MPHARIAMRTIHARQALSKDLVLRTFGPALLQRGFRLDHPDTIDFSRDADAEWMVVAQKDPPGRVPPHNQELQGLVAPIKQAWRTVDQILADGDFQGMAAQVSNRGVEAVGRLRDWLECNGDDRAQLLDTLEGVSGGTEGWSDTAGAQAGLLAKVLLCMGALREDIR